MVLSLYLSTNPRSSVYFFPVGSFTRSHLGLLTLVLLAIATVSDIVVYFGANIQTKEESMRYKILKYQKLNPSKKTIPKTLIILIKREGRHAFGVY